MASLRRCKLFYLSGLKHGRYPKMEVTNLCRFLSVIKFRPLVWRNSHPYVVADRVEDTTPPATVARDPNVSRSITLFGWVRGTFLKPKMKARAARDAPEIGPQRVMPVPALVF